MEIPVPPLVMKPLAIPMSGAGLDSVAVELVLGNQLFQLLAIPLIGLLPPQLWDGAYLSFPTNRGSWRCGFLSICPAPRRGRSRGGTNQLTAWGKRVEVRS